MDQRIFIILIGALLVMWGCTSLDMPTQQAPQPVQKQYICEDGRTIVSDLSTCPNVDTAMQECEKASSSADYNGDSDQDSCYYNLAVDRDNVSICKKIHTSSYYAYYTAGKCGAEIAINQGDVSICDSVGLIAKTDCYSEVAKQTSDVSICDKIAMADKRDTCIYNYITVNSYSISDWGICGKMSPNGYDTSYCYELAAEQTNDLKYCDKLSYLSSYSKSGCYAKVAKAQNNPSVCNMLNSSADKDSCYYDVGTTYPYDPNICSKITDSYTKDDCGYYANTSRNY